MCRKIAAVSIGLGLALLWGSSGYGQIATVDLSGTGSTSGAATQGATLGSQLNLGTGTYMGGDASVLQRTTPGQFVGGNAQGVGNLRGQINAATGAAGFGQMNMLGGMNPFNPMASLATANMLNNLSRQRRPLRMPITLGVEFARGPAEVATAPAKVGQRVQTQFVRIPQVRGSGSVNVQMDGQTAVLRGEVKSQRDSDLIGRMVQLEPGVADVRNELVVTPPETHPAAP